jgi:hypothetical protein
LEWAIIIVIFQAEQLPLILSLIKEVDGHARLKLKFWLNNCKYKRELAFIIESCLMSLKPKIIIQGGWSMI